MSMPDQSESNHVKSRVVHTGACSWSCKKDVASKHCACAQNDERTGRSMRSVEIGHFKDMMVEVATSSESSFFLITRMIH